jgi:uncharacterized membrane protein YbhN (UPF0104 family)
VTRSLSRWIWALAAIASVVAVLGLVFRFPWLRTLDTLAHVNVGLLATALLINLLTPVAKGWAWHLLLKPVAPHRWRVAQEANLIGCAVNSLAAGVTGEAARISVVMRRDGVPLRPAVLSVACSRVVEGLGLGLFLVLAPIELHLSATLRGLQMAAAVAFVAIIVMTSLRAWERLPWRLPAALRAGAAELATMSAGWRLIAPTALALAGWAAQWATYHLAIEATHLDIPYAASLTALVAVNVGGVIRLTPANVGIVQAAMVGALLPYGVAADQAIAAGLALQAIQVLPVLALTVVVAGWGGLGRRVSLAPVLNTDPPAV